MSRWIPLAGEKVVIPKGTPVYGYRSISDWEEYCTAAGKTYEVTVHAVAVRNVRTSFDKNKTTAVPGWESVPFVQWNGSGRLVKWARLEDVEPEPTDLERLAAIGRRWR